MGIGFCGRRIDRALYTGGLLVRFEDQFTFAVTDLDKSTGGGVRYQPGSRAVPETKKNIVKKPKIIQGGLVLNRPLPPHSIS